MDKNKKRGGKEGKNVIIYLSFVLFNNWPQMAFDFVKSQKDPSSLEHPEGLSQFLKAIPK